MLNLELLNKVEKPSLDYYAAIHSLHRRRRGNDISNDIFGNELKCEDLFKLYQPGEETYSTNLDSRGQHNATYRFETASLGSDF